MNLESKTALEFLTTGEGTWAPGQPNFVNPRSSRACWRSAWRRIPRFAKPPAESGSKRGGVGFTSGAIVGGAAAGPIGAVIGGSVGAMMGERSQKKSRGARSSQGRSRAARKRSRSAELLRWTASRQGGRGRLHRAVPHGRDRGSRQRSRAHRQTRRAGRGPQGRARAGLRLRRFARRRRAQPEPVTGACRDGGARAREGGRPEGTPDRSKRWASASRAPKPWPTTRHSSAASRSASSRARRSPATEARSRCGHCGRHDRSIVPPGAQPVRSARYSRP